MKINLHINRQTISQHSIRLTLASTFTMVAIALLVANLIYTPAAQAQAQVAVQADYPAYYREKRIHNPDGIGKYYMNREIAQVMGHQAMMWLERETRVQEEKPDLTVQNLNLKADDVIADIGAGSGYFSFRMAQQVPQGKVYAVDIQPEMLAAITALKKEQNITNIETVLGAENSPKLSPDSIDLALMVDAYHEFAYPREMMEAIVQALKPGGRVVLLEYRLENPMIMIKPLHKMSQKQVKKELQAVGLKWQETKEFLPQQHFLVFSKPKTNY